MWLPWSETSPAKLCLAGSADHVVTPAILLNGSVTPVTLLVVGEGGKDDVSADTTGWDRLTQYLRITMDPVRCFAVIVTFL